MRLPAACLTALATLSLTSARAQEKDARYLEYIDTYAPLAIQEMYNANIPASVTLAQGLLESGAGNSTLARKANNHFGIKCHSSWTGDKHYRKDDDRNRHGVLVESCFRSYDQVADSYTDHSDFLVRSPRYASLFELRRTDYKGWAQGLKKAGYATSRTYATHLIDIIERYELHAYDLVEHGGLLASAATPVLEPATTTLRAGGRALREPPVDEDAWLVDPDGGDERPAVAVTTAAGRTPSFDAGVAVHNVNDVEFTYPQPGETLADIAGRTRRYSSDLVKYNEQFTRSTQAVPGGTRVFLQPKRKSTRSREKRHRVGGAETMQSIADLYGVRTASLYKRNRMREGTQPAAGEVVQLRGRRKRTDLVRLRSRSERRAELADRSGARSPRREEGTASAATTLPSPARTHSAAPAPAPGATAGTAQTSGPDPAYVTVEPGDSLWKISRRTGVSVDQLRRANRIEGDMIHAGQRLTLK